MRKALLILLFSSFVFTYATGAKRKAIYIVVDGIPADQIERLQPPAIFDIASKGAYARSYTGGEVGAYTETPTISAPGYANLLTATWAYKHNVWGNDNLKVNYNYWTPFRIAKEQKENYTTGLFSTWIDNRTVLIGEGRMETNFLEIDFVKDGYDEDSEQFPKRENNLQIFDIDELVSIEAAKAVRSHAPDFSWVYLWYTDDAGHRYGNSDIFDEFVIKADKQVERIWDAVQYREANFDEEWMIVVVTDHGRTDNGKSHGGQSARERTTWISTNVKTNDHFNSEHLALIDVAPSMCRFLGFKIPQIVEWEQDGVPFVGQTDIINLSSGSVSSDNSVTLTWEAYNSGMPVDLYVATTDNFRDYKEDKWSKVATVSSEDNSYVVKLDDIADSAFYKFVAVTPNNSLNRWVTK